MPKASVKRIAIIGTGLIGGSIGKAALQRFESIEVVGFDESDVVSEALRMHAITHSAASLAEACDEAEVVFVATPLHAIPGVLSNLASVVTPGTLITDVGSVKAPVVALARGLPEGVTFVGGHPMAGSAAGGIGSSDPLLFENAVYVLTPPDGTMPAGSAPLIDLIEGLGARVLVMSPEVHDRVAAAVSHLPQMLAVALVEAAFEFGGDADMVSTLAAGGFRDMTRIAESPFATWHGILRANHGHVLDALATAARSIQRLRNRLIEEDYAELARSFDEAAKSRRMIPKDMRGFITPVHHLRVALEDRPGTLHALTGTLAEASINIKDIELVKIRDGAAGSFRIGFSSSEEATAARHRLEKEGFRVAGS